MDEDLARRAANPSLWEWDQIWSELKKVGIRPTAEAAEAVAESRERSLDQSAGRANGIRLTKKDRAARTMRETFGSEVMSSLGGTSPNDREPELPKPTARRFVPKLLPVGDGGADEY